MLSRCLFHEYKCIDGFLSLKPQIRYFYGIVIAEGVELYQFRLYLIYICKFLFLCDSFAPPLGLKANAGTKGVQRSIRK